MPYRLTLRAEQDLRDIHKYTTDSFGPLQAERYLRELDDVFKLLADFPGAGRPYHGKTHQFVHGRHIIIYRTVGRDMVIGRIFHGAQMRQKP